MHGEARGTALAHSAGIRRMVSKLLVRDPSKRARLADLWEDEWMRGEGAPAPPVLPAADELLPSSAAEPTAPPLPAENEVRAAPLTPDDVDGEADVDVDADVEDEGVLVDSEDIGPGSVARQEH